ncbi:hypothetical protein BASA81_014513 [Batrachochytrium salamandrivorans]|nr:hypothetical protein BASA81_014513 [Batrachochytrium salamandrivorans]
MLVLTRLVKLEVPEDDKKRNMKSKTRYFTYLSANTQLGSQLLLRLAYQTSSKVDTWMRVRALLDTIAPYKGI